MDIGTNSVRLAVVEVQPNGTWTTLASQKQVVRLGEGEFDRAGDASTRSDSGGSGHSLTEAAIARGALVCARFAEVARGFGAEEIVALATAAVREADNGEAFVQRVRDLADLDVRVISGQEEARLIYLGCVSGIDLPPKSRALFMDIGATSTAKANNRARLLDRVAQGGNIIKNNVAALVVTVGRFIDQVIRVDVHDVTPLVSAKTVSNGLFQ